MEDIEARILLSNLLSRVSGAGDGSFILPGIVTASELRALRAAIGRLGGVAVVPSAPVLALQPTTPIQPGPPISGHHADPVVSLAEDFENAHVLTRPQPAATSVASELLLADETQPSVPLDTSVLSMAIPEGMRLCLDFGTAMSKATVVLDDAEERILVLELGKPGDQEQLSPVMLLSSVYIDNAGLIWFGKHAVDRSLTESEDGSRQRLDNIKRRLSEDGFDDAVKAPIFAPIGVEVTYGQMILAYLTFLTWAANRALESLGLPRNIRRRFAMPCFPSNKSRDVSHSLKRMLGEAQVLADTFATTLTDGIPVARFTRAVRELQARKFDFPFIAEDITEPLGVAGALLSWRSRVDMLVMVVDVGAGTSDLSLYRVVVDPDRGINAAEEVALSARGITEAGNYLDRILIEFILSRAGIKSGADGAVAARSKLELNIRDYKETLFNEKFLFVALPKGEEVELELEEFLSLPAVRGFGDSLSTAMQDIMENVDPSFIEWVSANPSRYLTVALTGGGAMLPMVKALAERSISVRERKLRVQAALPFPRWLQDEHPELEDDFARIAVSLGGARKKLIARGQGASLTADLSSPPKLGGFYLRGG